ncbi:peptidoglycan editing factor PgeF [Paraliomyxa miuraensis]|uniref:peptidoglycan editing factor PgeF n=1 Tax=Paraliomyxa miuraensis TaxID=376150 RepID=UPI002254CA11|nr:peptidoglycan editing factor PgeF [Paraliomyxa miuraensis]MCX4243087.1 peptidoglycan editing factor PgeF [Paraliomyxa miuraensis]
MLQRAELFPSAITHGFTTREGGVSQGRHASLNLGSRGDDPEAVAENLRRVAEAGGFAPKELVRVKQVHGNAVRAAHEVGEQSEADALWRHRDHPGSRRVVGVMTADCVPILLCDRRGTMVAAVHSGWKGTVANITTRAIEVLREAGADPRHLLAAIGPCIELDAFEVGEEVAAQFDERFVARAGHAKPHVDLVACVRAQLEGAGVPAAQVERVGACTHARPDLYFSYRRDGAGIGQQLSFIGFR